MCVNSFVIFSYQNNHLQLGSLSVNLFEKLIQFGP